MTEKRDDSSGMGNPIQKSIRSMIGLHNLGIEKASPPVGSTGWVNMPDKKTKTRQVGPQEGWIDVPEKERYSTRPVKTGKGSFGGDDDDSSNDGSDEDSSNDVLEMMRANNRFSEEVNRRTGFNPRNVMPSAGTPQPSGLDEHINSAKQSARQGHLAAMQGRESAAQGRMAADEARRNAERIDRLNMPMSTPSKAEEPSPSMYEKGMQDMNRRGALAAYAESERHNKAQKAQELARRKAEKERTGIMPEPPEMKMDREYDSMIEERNAKDPEYWNTWKSGDEDRIPTIGRGGDYETFADYINSSDANLPTSDIPEFMRSPERNKHEPDWSPGIEKSEDEDMIQKSGNEGSTKRVKPADADDISDTGRTNGKQNVQGDWVSQDEAKEVTETNTRPSTKPVQKSFDQMVSVDLAYANATGELPTFRTIMKADLGEGLYSSDPETLKRAIKNSNYNKYAPRGKELKPIKNPRNEQTGEKPTVPMLSTQGTPEMNEAEPRGDYLNTTNKNRLINPEHPQTMEGRKINPDKTNVRPDPALNYEAPRPQNKEETDAAVLAEKERRTTLPKVEEIDHTNYTNPMYEGLTGFSDPADIDYTKPRLTPAQQQVLHVDKENSHDEQGNADYFHEKDAASHQGTGKAELSPYDIAAQQKAQKKVDNLRKRLDLEARKLFGGPGLEERRGIFINNGVNNYIREHNLGHILYPEGISEERAQQMKDAKKQSVEEHNRQEAEGLSPDEIVNQQVRNAKNREAGLKANEKEAEELRMQQEQEAQEWNKHVANISAQKDAAAKAEAEERAENQARNTAPDFESLNDPDRIDRALQEQMEAHRASQEKKRKKQSEKDKAKAQASKKKKEESSDEKESPVKDDTKKSGGSFREMMEYRMIEKASDRGYPTPYQVHVSDTLPMADTYRVVSMGDDKNAIDMRPRQADCKKR